MSTRTLKSSISTPCGFCAAPWLEAVARIDGSVLPCCRTDAVLGRMDTQSLADIWYGQAAREFRKKVGSGTFPTKSCEVCYRDGKATTLYKIFDSVVARQWSNYESACSEIGEPPNPEMCSAITRFVDLVKRADRQGFDDEPCRRLILAIFACRKSKLPRRGRVALRQLRMVARACLDFLNNRQRPKLVATMRQGNLVAVCNARCVHCVGLHTGEIIKGEEMNGRRFKRMSPDRADAALSRANDMTLFFMNGSEFLLYPKWRDLIGEFAKTGVQLSFATNGMLLDAEASALLLSSNVLRDVNLSFDGARRETVEAVRGKVRYDVLLEHARTFLELLHASGRRLTVSLSMVLLRQNAREARELVELADTLRDGRTLDITVSFQVLNLADNASYRAFYREQRVDIHDPETRAHLEQAADAGYWLGVPTYYSYTGTLRRALEVTSPREWKGGDHDVPLVFLLCRRSSTDPRPNAARRTISPERRTHLACLAATVR